MQYNSNRDFKSLINNSKAIDVPKFSIDIEKYLNITFIAYRNYPDGASEALPYGVICQCWLSNQNGALRRPDSVSMSRFGERRALLLARYIMRAYTVDVFAIYKWMRER